MTTESASDLTGETPGAVSLGQRLVDIGRATWSRGAIGIEAALIWLGAYAVVVLSGQRFDTAYLTFGWQLIPWDILSSDPWRSLWYLHVQPPLWNAALGISAWASPVSDAATLQILMAFFGVALAGASAILAHRLGLGRRSAIVVALIATLHPEVLKGAFEPTYELAVAALLVALAAFSFGTTTSGDSRRTPMSGSGRSMRSSQGRHVIAVAVIATGTALTRSLYHPVWVVAVIGLVLWFYRRRVNRRVVVVAILIPVIGIGAWMGKNQIVYDRPTLSSWFGMNLQRAVIPVLDFEKLEEMYERGQVSDVAMIGPFGNYGLYADVMEPCVPSGEHRSIVEPMRTTDEWSPNFNYECFLPVFDRAGQDAWAVIKEHPEAWFEGRLWSLRTTVAVSSMPAESESVVMRTLDRIYSWARLDYRGVLSTDGWGTPIYGQLEAPADFGLVLIPLYGLVVVLGLSQVRSVWRGLRETGDDEAGSGGPERRSLVLVITAGTVLFTVVVGAVAELGEQARFRTMTDPLVVVVAGAFIWPQMYSALARMIRRFRPQGS